MAANDGNEPPEERRTPPQHPDPPTRAAFSFTSAESHTFLAETLRKAFEQRNADQLRQQVVQSAGEVHNVFIGQSSGVLQQASDDQSLAKQRQKFHFDFLNHTLKQAEWTFRLSVWFMTGGALVILAGAVLALFHAGNPDVSYLPYVTALTGALITVGGGALALHSKRTMANLTNAAEDNEKKIDIDHKLEVATAFIDRVADSKQKDDLNTAAAIKALGMDAAPEVMVNRLLPDQQPKEIEPGDSTR
ncbi:TRADD-N-associated membrane domain-containing protein [Streptomyces niveus]|uniref:TRADD-N-associated membrane domain-containing protein n=1 Tax=Streptomyces niveus TaxID=193462 RepID=UPI0035DD1C57